MNLSVKNTVTGLFVLAWLADIATASARCPHKCHLLAKKLLKDKQLLAGGKFGLNKCTRKCRNLNGKKRYGMDLTEKECRSLCRTARRNIDNPKMTKTYCSRKLCDPKKPRKADTTCQQDSDCAKKNVGNCCGDFPMCVNKDFEPNLDLMQEWCEKTGTVDICGWEEFDSCRCEEGVCAVVPKPQVVCTEDAYECPDGKVVGRSGPDCEFDCGPCITEEVCDCDNGFPYASRIGPKCECDCEACRSYASDDWIFCPPDTEAILVPRIYPPNGGSCIWDCTKRPFDCPDPTICPNGKLGFFSGPDCALGCGP